MNISKLVEKPISAASSGPAKPADRTGASSASSGATTVTPEGGVSVKLSEVTQTMTNGVARSGTDVFNTEKVQAMRTAIENGAFSVNPEVIADKLLSNAGEMLRGREIMSVASGN
ncbi:MAG: hypothetical protein RL323_2032 [Pseudomonadota bacterium]|jgi:negative regulator of flagellin synthesis FlgM